MRLVRTAGVEKPGAAHPHFNWLYCSGTAQREVASWIVQSLVRHAYLRPLGIASQRMRGQGAGNFGHVGWPYCRGRCRAAQCAACCPAIEALPTAPQPIFLWKPRVTSVGSRVLRGISAAWEEGAVWRRRDGWAAAAGWRSVCRRRLGHAGSCLEGLSREEAASMHSQRRVPPCPAPPCRRSSAAGRQAAGPQSGGSRAPAPAPRPPFQHADAR